MKHIFWKAKETLQNAEENQQSEVVLIKCPKCEKGEIVEKKTRRGKVFYGCNQYPSCDYALWHKPVDKKCPKCDSLLVVKGKKNEIQCPNKECDYKEE